MSIEEALAVYGALFVCFLFLGLAFAPESVRDSWGSYIGFSVAFAFGMLFICLIIRLFWPLFLAFALFN